MAQPQGGAVRSAGNQPSASGGPARQQQPKSQVWEFIQMAQRFLLIFVAVQFVMKWLGPKEAPKQPPAPVKVDGVPQAAPGEPNPFNLPPVTVNSAWPLGTQFDMHVIVTTSSVGDVSDKALPQFVWTNFTLGDWEDARSAEYLIDVPTSVQHNASLWAHVFLCKNGASPDRHASSHTLENVHHVRKLLTKYKPKRKIRKEKSLLSGERDVNQTVTPDESVEPDTIISYWHPNTTFALVSDTPDLPFSSLSPVILKHVSVIPNLRDASGKHGYYNPILFGNDFWHLSTQYSEINTTTPQLPLKITMTPISYFKFQMYASFGAGFDDAAKQQGAAEVDEIKRMLVETNPYFLALTATVSVLHVVFEWLAFSADVSHWRKKNELVGVSVRTIITNVVVQAIILLYLLDNSVETSWMILFGQGTGILIELWKITKAVDIKIGQSSAGSVIPYRLVITDKHVLTEAEKKTQEYDKLAFKYVSWVTIPLLAGYAIYSVIYETHRNWYSFVISTLTSFVYAFGFVQLVPQLIINWKLKSVAHMPIKAMVYKTLSTVVDDLFAFCIHMPWMHRLACFRDDVVFLVFLYQRWIYRVDPKRVNEYGQVMTQQEEDDKGESRKSR